ncbi:PKD domain-containing protein [Mangrovibacterium lignilyticum]|uniref:PKD domain-containing protein n=1 Tax=Mangrovibacterium lignilyticum TaxID=2668052 RepID=UPI0013D78083|nr:PKD domain-containing protein [Mangrovibacterium lignilyticum]
MRSRVLIFLLVLLTSGFSYAQTGTLKIELKGNSSITFCKDSVQLAQMVAITGGPVNGGLKVSIANYKKGAESLACKSSGSSITTSWNNNTGTLEMKGNATVEEFEAAIDNTWYYNLTPIPDTTPRHIAISLNDADFLPATGHFYQFVQEWDVKWTAAKVAAAAKTLYGMQGYLATITSKVENDFIWTKISGVGWIGASDSEVEGDWKWMTGPEAGTLFWRGTYLNGQAINGAYSFWGNGEPNNVNGEYNGGIGEDYAHITQVPDQPLKSWNDLRDEGDGPDSQYFRPKGYVIEYGGMEDLDLQLSASFDIQIRKVIFSSKLDQTICRGDSVRLNQDFNGSYYWTPSSGLSDAAVPDPWSSALDSTVYLLIADYDGCLDTAEFTVNVNPVPNFNLGIDQNLCAGDSTILDAIPVNDAATSTYRWNTGANTQQVKVRRTGEYIALVENQYQCLASDTIVVTVHDYPAIAIADKNPLYCDIRTVNMQTTVDKGSVNWASTNGLTFTDPTVADTEVQALDSGYYQAYIEVADAYNCVSRDTVSLRFYDTPTTDISIDSTTCSGYSLEIDYVGDASDDAVFSWYYPDLLYLEGQGIKELDLQLGFQQTNQRQLGLQISESGCQSEIDWTPIRVTPNLDVTADITEGCMPLTVNFKAQTTEEIETYTWEFGDGLDFSTMDPTITHTYDYASTYDVTLTVTSADGCSNTGTLDDFITVNPLKTVYTDIDPSRCYPHQFDVNYTGSGNDQDVYNWDLSELASDEIINDPGTAMGPLTINLLYKPEATIGLQVVSGKGCMSETKTFSFKRQPRFELTADYEPGCAPLQVILSAVAFDPVDQLSYVWNTGVRDGLAGETVSEEYTEPGAEYPVSAIAISALTGCADTIVLDPVVKVQEDPVAEFEADSYQKLISDALFEFTNLSSGATSFEWDFDDGKFSTQTNPQNRYEEVGWFTVHLLAESEFACIDTVSHRVLVAPEDLFPPNAINPNSSNEENHVFLLATDAVKTEGYDMRIFNRWGDPVFESNDKTIGWDGKMENGDFAPAGTYVWVLTYRDVLDEPHQQKGTVTLVF